MAFILGTMLFYSIFSTIGVFVVSDNAQKQVWYVRASLTSMQASTHTHTHTHTHTA